MAKTKWLRKEGKTYKLQRWITTKKKEEIEKHSQANSHFLFKRSHSGFNWYVRTTRNH